ncbi:coiled-coil domain containing 169 [Osmerus mordax]|uniref:coiled-coil domain containing 169 n=1 Tax=Osmerus mordax TaxID=8014 RepID=UPI00350FEDB8
MGETDLSKYDLARLQAELEQEREMKEMLEDSISDLRSTLSELQDRLRSVDGEGNEWKTRYETQVDLNGQLKRQTTLLHERLEDLRGNPVDRLASIRSYDDMPMDALRQRLKLLTNEKAGLQSQLTDCRQRIEQEGKAFHKTNDERRAYLSEIAKDALRQRLKLLTNEKAGLQSQLTDCRQRIEQEGKAFHKTNDERRAYLSEIAKLSSTLDANRRQYLCQPRGAPESQQRGKPSKLPVSDSTRGGRGGGGAVRKEVVGSRLPKLKH